jgi:hypothetical protein
MQANHKLIKETLATLVRERIAGWHSLQAILYDLSLRGWRRGQLLNLLTDIAEDETLRLTEEDAGLFWDLGTHLIGQCNADQVIHLAGEPEDAQTFLRHVYEAKWREPRDDN